MLEKRHPMIANNSRARRPLHEGRYAHICGPLILSPMAQGHRGHHFDGAGISQGASALSSGSILSLPSPASSKALCQSHFFLPILVLIVVQISFCAHRQTSWSISQFPIQALWKQLILVTPSFSGTFIPVMFSCSELN